MVQRYDYRLVFEKTGRAKYISHLDLNRCMQRAIRRSGLPAWYTEGFHPHMYLMFAMALSLGAESLCESMDVRLTEDIPYDEVQARLNAALPEGLRVVRAAAPVTKATEIERASYLLELACADAQELLASWQAFAAQTEILVEKKSKRGMKTVDIAPKLQVRDSRAGEGILSIWLDLPAGNEGNLNVSVVTDAFAMYAKQPFSVKRMLREKIFCKNGEEFF